MARALLSGRRRGAGGSRRHADAACSAPRRPLRPLRVVAPRNLVGAVVQAVLDHAHSGAVAERGGAVAAPTFKVEVVGPYRSGPPLSFVVSVT